MVAAVAEGFLSCAPAVCYAAPELILGVRTDTKVDVFSFGVVLWCVHASAWHVMPELLLAGHVILQSFSFITWPLPCCREICTHEMPIRGQLR